MTLRLVKRAVLPYDWMLTTVTSTVESNALSASGTSGMQTGLAHLLLHLRF